MPRACHTASFPLLAPAVPRRHDAPAPAIRDVLDQHDAAAVGRRRPVHAVAALRHRPDAAGNADHPPRHRPLGDRQELRGRGRDSRRPEGEPAELSAALAERMRAPRSRAGPGARRAARAIAAERAALSAKARGAAAKTPIRPLALLHALGEMLPPDAVVVEETFSSAPGLRQLVRSDDPQSFFGLRGGGIGWGLPAAIGVKLALPHRPVVALIGDGSAMYTCQALWTAAHDRVGVVFVILNNRSYRILKQRTNAMKGFAAQTDRYIGMDITEPAVDYVALAQALGVSGARSAALGEAVELVRSALAEGGPH